MCKYQATNESGGVAGQIRQLERNGG